jgi:hypothetical protein
MTYATIEDGELTPLQGGHSDKATSGRTSTNKRAAVMVGATVVGALVLLMAGPLTMPMTGSSNVDTMIVASSTATHGVHIRAAPPYRQDKNGLVHCAPATGPFSGRSCKDPFGWCAGPGSSFSEGVHLQHFETCYVSQNGYCWSHSHTVSDCALLWCV